MNHLGLFEGIGGFSLAARWAGWHTVAWCEINPFCQTVLKYHFPNAKQHDDIKQTDFSIYRGQIDIITGGFPCQPYSMAGKRLGKEDERHLWPEMLRAIREVQPRWVVGENVSGLINWSGGLVFDEVQADLEAEGYEVRAFVLPACAVNAPHRRDRIWFVAYSDNLRISKQGESAQQQGRTEIRATGAEFINGAESDDAFGFIAHSDNKGRNTGFRQVSGAHGEVPERHDDAEFGDAGQSIVADATSAGRKERQQNNRRSNTKEDATRLEFRAERFSGNVQQWHNFPTKPPIRSRNDGLSDRLDGITFPKWRTESIKAYGNAIVPQVALQIFKSINEYKNI
jgi:DNA (cytosine-5)-methyltransferase 1